MGKRGVQMRGFVKPIVVVSKCLGFANCRYNGVTIPDDLVEKLKGHVEYNTVCPEVEIGLGIPRNPVRVVSVKGGLRLMQPATKMDITDKMTDFIEQFLESLKEVDGFILKYRSPSCGIKDVKVYQSMEKGSAKMKGAGFFGGTVLERFSDLAVEDEGRLKNFKIREHFLTRLFSLADFRRVKKSGSKGELVRFHTANKFLLMAYNQKELRILGRIVANQDKKPLSKVLTGYGEHFERALSRTVKYTSNINVLMHALGGFSRKLISREKTYFLETLERYRNGKIPLSAALGIMRAWIVRFESDYLMKQTYFLPYPEELVEITDSGKGSNL
jgi:uncharacterized protein YbgA (DUF1722 family)/uncharacterized protein YbbK (DUF523 family)